jgi:hypothetical protein
MLRDWRKVVLWGAVVFYACWILWWASAGYPLEGPICFGAGAKEDCANYNVIFYSAWQIAEFASHWAALITAIFIAFLAIVTARLWGSIEKLWRATYATMRHAGRASKNELRAYVGVEPEGIDRVTGESYLVGRFQIRNFGKTPARNLSVYSTIDFDLDERRRSFPIGKLRMSPTVLQPGARIEFSSHDRWKFPVGEFEADESGKMSGYLYVWGEVLYTDEFDTVGWTTFCHRYPCQMLGIGGVRRIDRRFALHHEEAGNEAG